MGTTIVTGTLLAACLAITACNPVKADINISNYRQILLLPVEVQFRAVRPGSGNPTFASQDRNFPVSPESQQRFAETVTTVFREELARSRHFALTNEPGPDVLRVRISLLDIVSNVPPEGPGRTTTYLDEFGAATLVLELENAMSGEILARTVDRRVAEPLDGIDPLLSRANPVTAWSAVRRTAQRWAALVTRRIDQWYDQGRIRAESGP